jgi:signal transduction histidine kinase
MALERVHDADNSLLLAQSHLSEILTRFKHDKHHPIKKSAVAASGHIDSAHKSIKKLVRRAKITKPNLGRHTLRPLLEAAVNEIKLHAETIGVTIRVACAEDVHVRCDKDLIHRVFINILHNALFFLETDRKSGDRYIEVAADTAGSDTVIRFCDNGPGIAPYDLDKVFDYFYTTKGERGMGFGLAIAKGIITHHGGTIQVRSRWGYETVFVITLVEVS